MEKKLILLRQNFSIELVNLINTYSKQEVPMFVMGDILKDILNQVNNKAAKQYEIAKEEYEKEIKENQKQQEEKQ